MPKVNTATKNELNTRKEILNKHHAKFNQLKEECKWPEAWSQLLVTLNYASDTLKYSTNLLKNISQKMPQLSPEQSEKIADRHTGYSTSGAMIVIPKIQKIH